MKKIVLLCVMFLFLVGCEENVDPEDENPKDPNIGDEPEDPIDEDQFTMTVNDGYVMQGEEIDFASYVSVYRNDTLLSFDESWIIESVDTTIIGIKEVNVLYEEGVTSLSDSFELEVLPTIMIDEDYNSLVQHEVGETFLIHEFVRLIDYNGDEFVLSSNDYTCDQVGTLGNKECNIVITQSGIELLNETISFSVVDTIAPTLEVTGEVNYTIGDEVPVFGDYVVAIDNYDGDVSNTLTFDFSFAEITAPGTYTVT
ncbi:MAG: hypothetical protein ACVCEJ_03290 [Candidatus Izemoplasmataceae bacterium]